MSFSKEGTLRPSSYAREQTLSTRPDTLIALCFAGTIAAVNDHKLLWAYEEHCLQEKRVLPFCKSISSLPVLWSCSNCSAIVMGTTLSNYSGIQFVIND